MNPVFFFQIEVLGTVARLEAMEETKKARPEKITLKSVISLGCIQWLC